MISIDWALAKGWRSPNFYNFTYQLSHYFPVPLPDFYLLRTNPNMIITDMMIYGSVSDYLKQQRRSHAPLPLTDQLWIAFQVAVGMSYLVNVKRCVALAKRAQFFVTDTAQAAWNAKSNEITIDYCTFLTVYKIRILSVLVLTLSAYFSQIHFWLCYWFWYTQGFWYVWTCADREQSLSMVNPMFQSL